MSHCLIISHLGAGKYNVDFYYGEKLVKAKFDKLEARRRRIDWYEKPPLESLISAQQAELNEAYNDLHYTLIPAYKTCISTNIETPDVCKSQSDAIASVQKQMVSMSSNLKYLKTKLSDLDLELDEIIAEQSRLNSATSGYVNIDIWCADLADGVSGRPIFNAGDKVATMEVWTGDDWQPVIAPLYTGLKAPNAKYGWLTTNRVFDSATAYYNAAMQTPTLIHRAKFAAVEVVSRKSNGIVEVKLKYAKDGINLDGTSTINSTPKTFEATVEYMGCDSIGTLLQDGGGDILCAMESGFVGAKLIGFVTNPQACITGDFSFECWDSVANRYFQCERIGSTDSFEFKSLTGRGAIKTWIKKSTGERITFVPAEDYDQNPSGDPYGDNIHEGQILFRGSWITCPSPWKPTAVGLNDEETHLCVEMENRTRIWNTDMPLSPFWQYFYAWAGYVYKISTQTWDKVWDSGNTQAGADTYGFRGFSSYMFDENGIDAFNYGLDDASESYTIPKIGTYKYRHYTISQNSSVAMTTPIAWYHQHNWFMNQEFRCIIPDTPTCDSNYTRSFWTDREVASGRDAIVAQDWDGSVYLYEKGGELTYQYTSTRPICGEYPQLQDNLTNDGIVHSGNYFDDFRQCSGSWGISGKQQCDKYLYVNQQIGLTTSKTIRNTATGYERYPDGLEVNDGLSNAVCYGAIPHRGCGDYYSYTTNNFINASLLEYPDAPALNKVTGCSRRVCNNCLIASSGDYNDYAEGDVNFIIARIVTGHALCRPEYGTHRSSGICTDGNYTSTVVAAQDGHCLYRYNGELRSSVGGFLEWIESTYGVDRSALTLKGAYIAY